MKKIVILTAVLFFIILSSVSYSEIVSRVLTYNGPGSLIDKCTAITQDNQGKVYATGVSWGGNSTKDDYATIKFAEDGDFLWVARYDGPGHDLDYASAITVDNNGNVYVTGWSRDGSNLGSEDFCTIKYNSNGIQQWVARYNGGIDDWYYYDYAKAIQVDAAGNVYITGDTWGNSNLRDDYVTIKYNQNGVLQWAKRYNGPSSKEDIPNSLVLDASGNVYVTGGSVTTGKGYDMLTVKYNNSGTQLWTARYDGPAMLDDIANELRVDQNGNVYITGSSQGTTSKLDYATLKYNASGLQQWLNRFNGASNDTDAATGLDLDVYNNVYVTGYSKSTPIGTTAGYYDYFTIKYASTNGSLMWQNKYDGGGIDKAWDIAVVNRGCAANVLGGGGDIPCWDIDIYVTGQSAGTGTNNDFVTLRYIEDGSSKWTNRFNGPTNASDAAYSLSAKNDYPIVYAGGSFANDYGIIGITEARPFDNNNFKGISTSYPNPFNPETNIIFRVAKESNVKIVVYDVLGKTIAQLVDKKFGAGIHAVNWNASNLNSGVYFYRIETDYGFETKKLVLVK